MFRRFRGSSRFWKELPGVRGRRMGPVVAAGLCVPFIVKCDDDVKLTTYNVLSPNLASPNNFPAVNKQDLEKDVRWPKIYDRLQKAVGEGRIIALQEVDLEWAGKLHSFFAECGYAVVFAQYGNKKSGYMGVTLAWPTKIYEALEVEISKMTDTAPKDAWPKSQQQSLSNFGYMTYDGLADRVQHVRKIWKYELHWFACFVFGGLFHYIPLCKFSVFLQD